MSETKLTEAAADGVASMLLDVQRECIGHRQRVRSLEGALRTALGEMLEARDRLLASGARTSGLDHGIEEARAALSNPESEPPGLAALSEKGRE